MLLFQKVGVVQESQSLGELEVLRGPEAVGDGYRSTNQSLLDGSLLPASPPKASSPLATVQRRVVNDVDGQVVVSCLSVWAALLLVNSFMFAGNFGIAAVSALS